MVKKGGTKRKIPMEKIVKKESLATCHTKRFQVLCSKASQLCLLSDAQIAILATPHSSNSNVSFFSFGHSSVDGIVSAFLAGQRHVPVPVPVPVPQGNNRETREDIGLCLTRKDLGLDLWWEDESLVRSDNPQELTDAMNSISKLLSDFEELRRQREDHQHQGFVNDHELKNNDVVVSDNGTKEQMDQQTLNDRSVCCIPDDDLAANFNNNTEEQDQILAICENFCATDNNNNDNTLTANLEYHGYEQEMDIDQLIDFDHLFDDGFSQNTTLENDTTLLANSEAPNLCCSDHSDKAFEYGDFEDQRTLDEDNLCFSAFFNTIAPI